jgi:hypothetical protein
MLVLQLAPQRLKTGTTYNYGKSALTATISGTATTWQCLPKETISVALIDLETVEFNLFL